MGSVQDRSLGALIEASREHQQELKRREEEARGKQSPQKIGTSSQKRSSISPLQDAGNSGRASGDGLDQHQAPSPNGASSGHPPYFAYTQPGARTPIVMGIPTMNTLPGLDNTAPTMLMIQHPTQQQGGQQAVLCGTPMVPICFRCQTQTAQRWVADPVVNGALCCDQCLAALEATDPALQSRVIRRARPAPLRTIPTRGGGGSDADMGAGAGVGAGAEEGEQEAPSPTSRHRHAPGTAPRRSPPKRRRPPPPSRQPTDRPLIDEEISDDEGRDTWRRQIRTCSICRTRDTVVWRKGPKGACVCNRCGIAWSRKIGRHVRKRRGRLPRKPDTGGPH